MYSVPSHVKILFLILVDFRPIGYAIPSDGPVGALLGKLGRHVFRPAHLHMMIAVSFYLSLHTWKALTFTILDQQAPGYEKLVTALYFRDEHLTSDAVFGVRASLIVVRMFVSSLYKRLTSFLSRIPKLSQTNR